MSRPSLKSEHSPPPSQVAIPPLSMPAPAVPPNLRKIPANSLFSSATQKRLGLGFSWDCRNQPLRAKAYLARQGYPLLQLLLSDDHEGTHKACAMELEIVEWLGTHWLIYILWRNAPSSEEPGCFARTNSANDPWQWLKKINKDLPVPPTPHNRRVRWSVPLPTAWAVAAEAKATAYVDGVKDVLFSRIAGNPKWMFMLTKIRDFYQREAFEATGPITLPGYGRSPSLFCQCNERKPVPYGSFAPVGIPPAKKTPCIQ